MIICEPVGILTEDGEFKKVDRISHDFNDLNLGVDFLFLPPASGSLDYVYYDGRDFPKGITILYKKEYTIAPYAPDYIVFT